MYKGFSVIVKVSTQPRQRMKTSQLYDQLHTLLGQSTTWADQRHLKTLIWMVIGLICSECISLTKWTVFVKSRAMYAQSHQRRFSRWLHNPRINVQRIYSELIQAALRQWGVSHIVLIEDTSLLWNEYCLVRLSVQYRGRAIPLVWRVLRHKSTSIRFDVHQAMLKRAARLIPVGVSVCLLADRGFADTQLMRYLRHHLHWHFRIRVKNNTWIHRGRHGWIELKQYHLNAGEVILLHDVTLTKKHRMAHLHLALARDPLSGQLWMFVSDQLTTLQSLREYGDRFQIEEELLDEKSNGFQLERSEVRSAPALSRLCLVMGIATLLLTVQGQQVVATGKRRWVDAHWQRGNSYLRIGWSWVKGVLHQQWPLFPTIFLSGEPDRQPVFASKKHAQRQWEREFTVHSYQCSS